MNTTVFIAGCTSSTDLEIPSLPFVPYQGALVGPSDGFIASFNSATGALESATYLGGESTDWVAFNDVLEIDVAENIVVAGMTRSVCFPLMNAIDNTHSSCSSHCGCSSPPDDETSNDLFVSVLAPTLSTSSLLFSTYIGGSNREEVAGLAVDEVGNIYLCGETLSSNFPVTLTAFDGSFTTRPGDNMAFLTKLDPVGTRIAYSTYLGGDIPCGGASVDGSRARSMFFQQSSGNVVLCGQTTHCDFPAKPDAVFPVYQSGERDGWINIHRTH